MICLILILSYIALGAWLVERTKQKDPKGYAERVTEKWHYVLACLVAPVMWVYGLVESFLRDRQ